MLLTEFLWETEWQCIAWVVIFPTDLLIIRFPKINQMRDIIRRNQHIARTQIHMHNLVLLDNPQSLQHIDEHINFRTERQNFFLLDQERSQRITVAHEIHHKHIVVLECRTVVDEVAEEKGRFCVVEELEDFYFVFGFLLCAFCADVL